MQNSLNTISWFILLSQVIYSIALRQEVVIYKLSGFESNFSGNTRTINMNDSTPLSELSVFGWINMSFSEIFKDILEFKVVATNNQYYSFDPTANLIFYLQYLNWGTYKLKFGCYINDKEDYSYFDLSADENNQWIFIYLGHSFPKSKQTYYLKSKFNEQLLTKPVSKIENLQFCQISAGAGKFQNKEFMNGKIERLTVQTGQGAYTESDFEVLSSFHPDTVTKCAVGFDQCGFIGQYVELCGDLEKPKSVLMQDTESVKICANHREIIVKENIDCIDDGDLINLHMNYAIDFSDNPNDQCEKL